MATAKILLLSPIVGLGGEGDVVLVKAGYARNYLLPKRKAIPLTRSNRKQIENLKKAREIREMKEREGAQMMAKRLRQLSQAIAVKTGEEGRLFGSVTVADIRDRLKQEGIEVAKDQIRLPHPLKVLGKHEFRVKLHEDVGVDMGIEVVSENPIEG
ncbi:MAG: 50S ribosomal protein L9 [Puniceicoccales bacterium]|jgi:large subunit ribosomal protein L9|nr:50S ribosomal protein L9 [Puniceicoccales bacterium]